MPYMVRKQGTKYRVLEKSTGKVATNDSGTPVDGGGHKTAGEATRQAQAINISEARKSGHRIPQRRK